VNVVDVLIVIVVTGGTDAQDAVRGRSLSAKEPLIIGLFCRKRHIKRIQNTFRVIDSECC